MADPKPRAKTSRLSERVEGSLPGGRHAGCFGFRCSQSFSQSFSPPERADLELGEDAEVRESMGSEASRYQVRRTPPTPAEVERKPSPVPGLRPTSNSDAWIALA